VNTHREDAADPTPRRGFLKRITAGAVALGLPVLTAVPARAAPGAGDDSDWPGTLKGSTVRWWMHTRRTMGFARHSPLRSWRQADQRAGPRPGDRGGGSAPHCLPLALDHPMWQKYKIGQSLSILDPETKAPAVKNPFLQPKPGVLLVDDMAIDRLLANGTVIGACNLASRC